MSVRASIIILVLVGMTACIPPRPQYAYTPQANSAYIFGSASAGKGIFGGDVAKDAIAITAIDGQSAWPSERPGAKSKTDMELVTAPVAVAPGPHQIETLYQPVVGQKASSMFVFNFVAQPGERYVIQSSSEGYNGFFTAQSNVSAWIVDSKGRAVTQVQSYKLPRR